MERGTMPSDDHLDAYARLLVERLTRLLAGLDQYEPSKISEQTLRNLERRQRKEATPGDPP